MALDIPLVHDVSSGISTHVILSHNFLRIEGTSDCYEEKTLMRRALGLPGGSWLNLVLLETPPLPISGEYSRTFFGPCFCGSSAWPQTWDSHKDSVIWGPKIGDYPSDYRFLDIPRSRPKTDRPIDYRSKSCVEPPRDKTMQ